MMWLHAWSSMIELSLAKVEWNEWGRAAGASSNGTTATGVADGAGGDGRGNRRAIGGGGGADAAVAGASWQTSAVPPPLGPPPAAGPPTSTVPLDGCRDVALERVEAAAWSLPPLGHLWWSVGAGAAVASTAATLTLVLCVKLN